MVLKTTTWIERNVDNLELTKEFAIKKNMKEPEIIDFGPGGSVSFLAKYMPAGSKSELSLGKRFLRVFESFIRKTGLFRLKTNEPREIASIFQSLSPKKLTIYDREKKVIDAVNMLVEQGEINIPVLAQKKDILDGPVDTTAEIVIALNIVSRTNNRAKALENIISATIPGGLICINVKETPAGFKRLGHSLFERL